MKAIADWFSRLLDTLSESLAHRKGLVPLIGLSLVVISMVISLVLPDSYLARSSLLLHLGVLTAIFGLMLGQAL